MDNSVMAKMHETFHAIMHKNFKLRSFTVKLLTVLHEVAG